MRHTMHPLHVWCMTILQLVSNVIPYPCSNEAPSTLKAMWWWWWWVGVARGTIHPTNNHLPNVLNTTTLM